MGDDSEQVVEAKVFLEEVLSIPAADIAKAVKMARALRPKKKSPAKKKAAKKAGGARARSAKQKVQSKKKPYLAKNPKKRGPKGLPESKRHRYGDMAWGARVAKKRIALGFTQGEFGAKIGILQPHVCNIERGTFPPSPKLREKVDQYLLKHVGAATKKKPRK